MTRAMILAAGLGTRLGALSDERPKPLLPVADAPLIRYAVALLHGHGVRDLVVNLHHRGELIERELGDGAALGVSVRYSREERILGTGGGIRHALPLLGDEPFVVMNGKVVFELDLGDVLARHRATGAGVTIVVREDPEAHRWGAIDAPPGGGRVRGLLGAGAYMYTGVQVLDPALVARLPDDGAERCIVRRGWAPWLAEGVHLEAYVAPGYFMEHSTPERYLQGNINVLRGLPHLRFPPGELTGIDPSARIHASSIIIPPVRIGPGAVIGMNTTIGPDAVIGTRAVVAKGLYVNDTVVWPDALVESHASRAIITPRQRLSVSPGFTHPTN